MIDEWGLPDGIKEHSLVVRDIALQIVKKIKENNKDIHIDERIVETGALLHDIGRVVSHGLEHGFRGYLLLKEARVDNRVARCALVHVLGGFTLSDVKKEFPIAVREEINEPLMPESIEEKIVCLADKHAVGTIKVSMNKRFARWFKKHG
nr:HD domain-containing protein [Candidatus Sigynarchaeota archaeon]